MSKFLKLFLALIVVAGCSPKENSGNLTISTENGDVCYNVEEAQTPEELEKGLMNRDSLAADSGMIFNLADVENQVAMWMKDTKIPLDMLFVNSNGRIFFIEENATPMSEELIIAPEPALAVIELNAGDVKKHGIKIGDTVKHHFFDEFNKKVYEDEGKQPPREEESNSVSSQEVQEDAQPQPADTEPASPSDEGSPVSRDGEINKTEKVLSE